MNYGTPIDYIEILGTNEKNSTEITEFPKVRPNYADKTVYNNVAACSSNTYESQTSSLGSVDTLVNPDSTVMMGTHGILFQMSNEKSSTPYTWFAINLGQVRSINEIDLYQWKDRISEVEVYSLTAEGQSEGDKHGGLKLSDDFMGKYATYLKTQSIYHYGNSSQPLNTKESLTTPSIINLFENVETQYILIRVSKVVDLNAGVVLCEVHVKGNPVVTYENNFSGNTLNYTTKFVNKAATTKKYAVVTAQYNADDEMIANNIEYVNVDALYSKSFAGTITKVDGAATIKVFSLCVDELSPLETNYTFNVAQ